MPPSRRLSLPKLLHPRYWPLYVVFALGWLSAQLPYRWQTALGRWVGERLYHRATFRRHIAEVNLQLCLPALDAAARAQLLQRHFRSLGLSVAETAMSWWMSRRRLARLVEFDGLHNLEQALAGGRGVILLAGHFTTLEIGCALLGTRIPFAAMYREHKNPVIDAVMRRGRSRNMRTIQRSDVRAMLQTLKQGLPVWYAPDQDYGKRHSVFVPFMGVPAATVTTTARFAKLSGAPVVPFHPRRRADGSGYILSFYPMLEAFPGSDASADTARVNDVIEQLVREAPEHYLWIHRRFKTQPPGAPHPYRPKRPR